MLRGSSFRPASMVDDAADEAAAVLPIPATKPERFNPTSYVLSICQGRKLSLAARLLALVLAHKLRRMADGQWRVWRGRPSLAALSGLSTKTVTTARRELIEEGLFVARRGVRELQGATGRTFHVVKGVIVLELVRNVDAFLAARQHSRESAEAEIEAETQFSRLQIQQRWLRGEITEAERLEEEARVRATERQKRRFPR
jgi:hypothetical protein